MELSRCWSLVVAGALAVTMPLAATGTTHAQAPGFPAPPPTGPPPLDPQAAPARTDEAARRLADSQTALERIVAANAAVLPATLVEQAVAVAVFDNVVQAAFVVGGRGGSGIISRRTTDGWTAPAFFRLGGASIGAQIGGGRADVLMLFMTERALERLLDNRLEFGADVTAVAGDQQAHALRGEQRALQEDVVVYSRDRGLFAGVSLQGAVITPDNDLNRSVYGAPAHDLLAQREPARVPDAARAFTKGLSRHLQPVR
jgi:SH3 domain-containing YSC84-like protein 1